MQGMQANNIAWILHTINVPQSQLLMCRLLWKYAHPEDGEIDENAYNLEIELLKTLGWQHWARAELSSLYSAVPPGYQIL